MIPDDPELRRALEARSGETSPEFRARVSRTLAQDRPGVSRLPAVAAVVVILLSATSVGVLLAARNAGRVTHGGIASGARSASPTPLATESQLPMPNAAQLDAPATNALWVLVGYDHLYRSTDQGSHWEQRPLPPQLGVRPNVSFVDDHEGWLLAPGSPATQCEAATAAVWHTSDAGTTWQQLGASGLADAQCKNLISFVDSQHGLVSAWDDNHRPTIYRTSDGGVSWTPSTLPDPPDFVTQPGGFVLQAGWVKSFGSGLYLESWGSQDGPIHDRQYIFRSTDGGATWLWLLKIPSPYIVMVTESRWLQLVVPDQSMESVNAGQQWHPYASDFNTDTPVGGPQIVFADSQVGYAEGRGALQRTADGGLHWVRIKTPGT